MWNCAGRPGLALVFILAIASAGCTASGGGTPASSADAGASAGGGAGATIEPADEGEGPLAGVDVCKLASANEVANVMGVAAKDPTESMMGPGAGIDGAKGCYWSLGDGVDLFDLWIYSAPNAKVAQALDDFWSDGYAIEPVPGIGDEAFAAVWRGDPSTRDVGQVAGVGVRQGDKAVLITTLLLGDPYLDPKPAADLALTILGRF